MKVNTIKQNIINNYKQLSQMAKVSQKDNQSFPLWGLNYKKGRVSGFVGQYGDISRNSAEIKIKNDGIEMIKKPFLSTWKGTLNNINKMLEDTKANFENKDVVLKRVVSLLCFPGGTVFK